LHAVGFVRNRIELNRNRAFSGLPNDLLDFERTFWVLRISPGNVLLPIGLAVLIGIKLGIRDVIRTEAIRKFPFVR
jgi:hypothetical protein